jgi:hypothetical protein
MRQIAYPDFIRCHEEVSLEDTTDVVDLDMDDLGCIPSKDSLDFHWSSTQSLADEFDPDFLKVLFRIGQYRRLNVHVPDCRPIQLSMDATPRSTSPSTLVALLQSLPSGKTRPLPAQHG